MDPTGFSMTCSDHKGATAALYITRDEHKYIIYMSNFILTQCSMVVWFNRQYALKKLPKTQRWQTLSTYESYRRQ